MKLLHKYTLKTWKTVWIEILSRYFTYIEVNAVVSKTDYVLQSPRVFVKLIRVSESRSVVSDSLRPCRLYSPWNSPGQNTGVGSLSLLQGIFPTQGSNPGLPHCRWSLYQLSYKTHYQAQTKGLWFTWSRGGAWEFAFLPSSQVMLRLLVQEPYFENYSCTYTFQF